MLEVSVQKTMKWTKLTVHGCCLCQVDGDYHYDARKGQLLWSVELVDDSGAAPPPLASPLPSNTAPFMHSIDVTRLLRPVVGEQQHAGSSACFWGGDSSSGTLRSACRRKPAPVDI
jgi:hypothetical protein